MKQQNTFTQMRQEDRKFGEKVSKKHSVKDHNKHDRYKQQFHRMRMQDIFTLED